MFLDLSKTARPVTMAFIPQRSKLTEGAYPMRKSTFATIRILRNSKEAETLLCFLQEAGLHPVELALSTPFPLPGEEMVFPIQIPHEEEHVARELVEMMSPYFADSSRSALVEHDFKRKLNDLPLR